VSHAHALKHSALLYERPEELVGAAVPFLRSGLERGEAPCAVLPPQRQADVRDALGDAADDVEFHAPEEWYDTPARRLAHLTEAVGRGRPFRAVGELAFSGRGLTAGEAVREWGRFEAILTGAFAHAKARLLCPYDTSRLPAAVVENARRTHPHLHGQYGANRDFDAAFIGALDGSLPPVPEDAAGLSFDERPGPAREFVTAHAESAGITGRKLEDLRLAASELATNAITHGRPPRSISAWVRDGRFSCEVRDGGRGIESAYAGFLVPALAAPNGRGIWIARQVCDLVEVEGSRVRVHMAL